MRSNKLILSIGLLILGIAATGSALAQRHAYRHGGGGYHGYYGGHHHGHSHFSFGLGFGFPWAYPYYGGYYPYYGGYYPYYGGAYAPYYNAPYPYYGEGQAPEYIERGDGGAPPYAERSDPAPQSAPQPRRRAEGTWHFCPESNGYYPYVQQCPGGWQRVPARPPGDSGAPR